LRYYERLGLLASIRISRLPNGHRRYSEVDLEWIDFVKCLRSTAMPIAEQRTLDIIETKIAHYRSLESEMQQISRRIPNTAGSQRSRNNDSGI
jgi:DNA-binding transcriptional MerR regulator